MTAMRTADHDTAVRFKPFCSGAPVVPEITRGREPPVAEDA